MSRPPFDPSDQTSFEPRIRDLEEMDRRYRRAELEVESKNRLLRMVLVAAGLALLSLFGVGWWQLNPRLAQLNSDLQQLQGLVSLRTTECRRYLPGQRADDATEAKLIEAEHELVSADVPTRLRGLQEYRRLSRQVCARAQREANESQAVLSEELAMHTKESTALIRRFARTFNQHAQEYNRAAKRFPASWTRPLLGLPASTPSIPDTN